METKTSASDGGDLNFELQTTGLSVVTGEKHQDDDTAVSNTIESVFRVSGATGLFSNKINGKYACWDQGGLKRLYHTEKTFNRMKKDGSLDQTTISFCSTRGGKAHWIIERHGLYGAASCYLLAYCKLPNLPHPTIANKWYVVNASEDFRVQPHLKVELTVDSKAGTKVSNNNRFRSRMHSKGVISGVSYF